MIDADIKRILEKQHYRVVGRHSAVKLCHWTKKSILDEGFCYKQQFYGIASHRCLQMTPAVVWCNQKCIFCWRNMEYTPWTGLDTDNIDGPKDIIDGAIEAQRKLLSGYGGIPDRINKTKFREAQDPNQAAISLSGEPTLYPDLDGLIGEFHKRKFTTFLVTNGTMPERLGNLENLPTQLYLSLNSPNEEIYKRVCNPLLPRNWEEINKTIGIFPSLDTRKVIRITAVKGLNMPYEKGYAKLIERADPDFVEVKSFMFVGGSRLRLSMENMPSFSEIMEFSGNLCDILGYEIKDYKEDSRVILLSKG